MSQDFSTFMFSTVGDLYVLNISTDDMQFVSVPYVNTSRNVSFFQLSIYFFQYDGFIGSKCKM